MVEVRPIGHPHLVPVRPVLSHLAQPVGVSQSRLPTEECTTRLIPLRSISIVMPLGRYTSIRL